ncbi:MAG: DUF4282 domain-containing protein [Oscillospiraceae bacterium]|nr:DUF4282 domain-containing protein [Oscillospiraceae bacterium]
MFNSTLPGLTAFIALALVVAGMIFLYLKIIPKKYDQSFANKLYQGLHDYFNFKKLYIEEVLKFLFTLLTVFCVAAGIATILSSFFGIFQNLEYLFDGYLSFGELMGTFFSGVLVGVLIIVLGTIVVRLVYEGILMFILLVKNVIEINNKTK